MKCTRVPPHGIPKKARHLRSIQSEFDDLEDRAQPRDPPDRVVTRRLTACNNLAPGVGFEPTTSRLTAEFFQLTWNILTEHLSRHLCHNVLNYNGIMVTSIHKGQRGETLKSVALMLP